MRCIGTLIVLAWALFFASTGCLSGSDAEGTGEPGESEAQAEPEAQVEPESEAEVEAEAEAETETEAEAETETEAEVEPEAESEPETTLEGIGDGEVPGSGGGAFPAMGGAGPATAPSADDVGALDDTSGASRGESGESDPAIGAPVSQVEPGTLTAGAWDDNRNYEHFQRFRAELLEFQEPGLLPTTDSEHDAAHERFAGERPAKVTLDVSLVIDTTGSMGDEIAYLQTEFLALSGAIEDAYPDAAQRWSLVVYRDTTDEYVARWFDFRDSASEFREHLAMQVASGGGDYPEAPDAAFEAMNQLAWRTDEDTARLAFWVADAPHHEQNAGALAEGIRTAAGLDIHVYPVASSGVDKLTELSMRSAAQLTGGRYLFLTDDSGVGGAHLEPSIPCYFVTKLDRAIYRMVDIELSGRYREPDAADILRAGGDPEDGACTLESGDEVYVF